MTSALLMICGLLAAAPDVGPTADDLTAYDAARLKTGRDADSQVKLALWCEARGLKAERVKHLALAVLADPKNATARGLMGLVVFGDRWKRPEAVAEKVKADEKLSAKLAAYNARRETTAETADAQWKLALWCEETGLDAEARAHFTAVTRLDPAREAAWKRLGCKKVGNRWVTEAQLTAEKEEIALQKKADKHWKPLLTKWRAMLGDKTKHEAAEEALAGLTDPRAVPSILAVFVAGGAQYHEQAVELLSRIDAPASSQALALLAVFNTSAEIRRAATETLKRRDPREYAGLLVAMLRKPVKYEVKPVGGPGSPGVLFVEGERVNVQRLYAAPALPPQARVFVDGTPFDPFGLQNMTRAYESLEFGGLRFATTGTIGRVNIGAVNSQTINANPGRMITIFDDLAAVRDIQIGLNMLEVQNAASKSQQQLATDVARIDNRNTEILDTNARVVDALNQVTGLSLSANPDDWAAWWTNQLGYASPISNSDDKPTLVENISPYIPQIIQIASQPLNYDRYSCFGAGTLVRTLDGSRAIESLKVGDRILTQSVKNGSLSYQPVTLIHHNPPSPTFLVKVNGETIVSSPFHRFWVAGKGWVMARDLKGGEALRFLDGPARIESVNAGPVQPVFNLDVADAHDFFAGVSGALVHDNTLPDTRIEPFDAAR